MREPAVRGTAVTRGETPPGVFACRGRWRRVPDRRPGQPRARSTPATGTTSGFMVGEEWRRRHGWGPLRKRFQGLADDGPGRGRAGGAAAAHGLHEPVRGGRGRGGPLLSGGRGPACWRSTTRSSSPSATYASRKGAGWAATTACAASSSPWAAGSSGACASAWAGPTTRGGRAGRLRAQRLRRARGTTSSLWWRVRPTCRGVAPCRRAAGARVRPVGPQEPPS